MIAIIDYGSGNLRSAEKACSRAAAECGRSCEIAITADLEKIRSASHIILPGVGAFGDCARGVAAIEGLRDTLEQRVIVDRVPFLGICVGMQLLANIGYEHGEHAGFGWIGGAVRRMPSSAKHKIPHIGWNDISPQRPHPVLESITSGSHFYFVHSYAFAPKADAEILAKCEHGDQFVAMVGRQNIVGVQFHPEKSQKLGLHLLRNFLCWDGLDDTLPCH